MLEEGQVTDVRREGPGKQLSLQVQMAQAGELPQLWREGAGQGAPALPNPCGPLLSPRGLGVRIMESQIQVFQLIELAQFRREGLEVVQGCHQHCHAPLIIEGGPWILHVGGTGSVGVVDQFGGRWTGEDGLIEPICIEDFKHGAVVSGGGGAPHRVQGVG